MNFPVNRFFVGFANELIVKEIDTLKFTEVIVVGIIWSLNLQLPLQSVPITSNVVSSNPADGEVYLIQYYVIKFVSDVWKVCDFLRLLRFPQPIKLTATI